MNAQSMMKFARQLDWDMQAVALNQTAVGFSNGNDTFGWRFYPRYQTPPNKGNVVALWESLAGGPTTDQDLRHRQLEPQTRECVGDRHHAFVRALRDLQYADAVLQADQSGTWRDQHAGDAGTEPLH